MLKMLIFALFSVLYRTYTFIQSMTTRSQVFIRFIFKYIILFKVFMKFYSNTFLNSWTDLLMFVIQSVTKNLKYSLVSVISWKLKRYFKSYIIEQKYIYYIHIMHMSIIYAYYLKKKNYNIYSCEWMLYVIYNYFYVIQYFTFNALGFQSNRQ